MSQSKTFSWYECFKDGQTSVDDDERSGLLSTSTTPENIAKVCKAILADRRQTIHYVCEIAGLSYGTTQRILADNLNMRRISARFVPRLLSDDQKALRVSVCRERKQQARDDPNVISNIIISNETWVSCVRFAGCCSILQTGHITLSSTPDQLLENHSTKYHRQQPLYNTPELLVMGIVVPETC